MDHLLLWRKLQFYQPQTNMPICVVFEDIYLPQTLVHAGQTNRIVFDSDLLSEKVHLHLARGFLPLNYAYANVVIK